MHPLSAALFTNSKRDVSAARERLFGIPEQATRRRPCSERVAKSGVTGQAMKEAQGINKSLSALGDVMEALDKGQSHIPFRNSKLTFLLQVLVFTRPPTHPLTVCDARNARPLTFLHPPPLVVMR